MSCHAYQLTMKVSSPQKVDLNLNQPLMIGAVLFPRIIECQLCLIMTLVEIERERVYLVLVHLKSCISSVSAWTIEVYIDISVPLLLSPMSFSGVVGQAELT